MDHDIFIGDPDAVVPAARPGPASSFPYGTARTLSFLANLIDSSIALRGAGIGVRDFAASFLQAPTTNVVVTDLDLGALAFQLTALALAEDLAAHPPAAVIGEDQEEPPRWTRLDLGADSARIPVQVAAAFGAGAVMPCAAVVATRTDPLSVAVYSRADDAKHAEAYLDDLVRRGRERTNPYRLRTLTTFWHSRLGLSFRVVEPDRTTRADVVLPAAVWAEIDRNVHGLFDALPRLIGAGLATNRGVLLAGPPGTGKTAVCRALATELHTQVTVVFCDASAVAHALVPLYQELRHLAPALVVMEDVDLVIGHRNHDGGGAPLLDFLVALDGAMSAHQGVVTIATTNDVRAIDPAARRSARFDALIEIPPPDATGRAAILRRYLAGVGPDGGADIDVEAVAAATAGFTGADLRELVSAAMLDLAADERAGRPAALDTSVLVRRARATRRVPPAVGAYL